ncbi:MAG: arginine--tRNA ligase [Cyclobacteriaceae bacterium]|nr:arginine--tRNA ligase [Cyclobacteriaceae bacterium]
MGIEEQLCCLIEEAFNHHFQYQPEKGSIALQATRKEFEGEFTFVTFPYLKISKKKPEETATIIGQYIISNSKIAESFNVVKGFLNIKISSATWLQRLLDIQQNQHYGRKAKNNQKVVVEYSSPNTNKPLHLGHLRNNFLGYSVSCILEAEGYEVIKVNLVNDRGIHICKSMLAYQKFGNGETPESSDIKGDHLIGKYYVRFDQEYKKEMEKMLGDGIKKEDAEKNAPLIQAAREMLKKWESGDQEVVDLWNTMNNWVYEGFDVTYKRMGVEFDHIYKESETYLLGKTIVDEGLKRELFYRKPDGSVWVDLSDEGLDEKLLLRSDGTSVYITQDLGTADLKYNDYQFDKSVYVVGNEQDYHFEVLFRILKRLKRNYAVGLYHLSYGMVDLPSGKMKSREGTVVDADDLMQEMAETAQKSTAELGKIEDFTDEQARALYEILGLGALKYFLLKVDPKKRMLFNPEESIQFHGNTGPFIQYTFARISSLLRKAQQEGLNYTLSEKNLNYELHETEREVIFLISQYEQMLSEAAENFSPSVVAQYVFELAKEYNRFYAELSVMGEKDPVTKIFRVAFSALTAKTIKNAMGLLGIEVPEKM